MSPPLDSSSLREVLWKVIQRFDLYLNSVNTKGSLLIAFNTFVLTSIVLKWPELLDQFGASGWTRKLAGLFFAGCAIAALASMAWCICAVFPSLKSPQSIGEYQSLLFFGHVSQFKSETEYLQAVTKSEEDFWLRDLAYQAHSLADIARRKFEWLSSGTRWLLYGELIPIALLILLKLGIVFFSV